MYSWGLRFESKAPSDVMIGTLSSGSGGDMSVCVRTVRHMHLLGSCSATPFSALAQECMCFDMRSNALG